MTLARSFEQQGFRVRVAHSGEECLVACHKHCPDLVVLDEAMEDPSAAMVQVQLQSDLVTSDARVVVLDRPELRQA